MSATAAKIAGGGASILTEAAKLGREMVAIPVQLWLAAAEAVAPIVLAAWRRVLRPALIALYRLLRAALRVADRHVTPARAVAATALVAAGALIASQWLDYHAVSVGTDAYAGSVGSIAPAPDVSTEITGHAHGWVMVPLGAVAIVAVVMALAGRRRLAALLVPIGIAVIAIALVVDLPKGLDEGTAAIAYEGAHASLLEGFWMQIAAAVVLVAGGLLLPRYLRPATGRELRAGTPTGPSLADRLAAAARERAARPLPKLPSLSKPKLKLPKPKRKVQGAGT